MGGKIWFIFIAIIVLGFAFYLYSSGLLVKGFDSFNSLVAFPNSSSSLFGSKSTSSFWSFLGIGGSPAHGPNIPPPAQSTITAPPTPPTLTNNPINPADIPAGYTAAQLSPYFHEVRLGSVTAGTPSYYGTIILDTDFPYNVTGSIDVTGWQIKSKNSGEYIPQAINIYDPTGLTPANDIKMRNNDTVYLYSSSAPFNLRLNECIGYVAHVANFNPALPLTCPYVDRSQIQNFTGQCQNYINSIGQCQAPNMSSPQIPQTDYACQDYLENNFTYKSCFSQHASDPNFLSNEVWVWTGSNVVDQAHDTVTLLDRNGLLVDLYTY
jgi:hypothetical protein